MTNKINLSNGFVSLDVLVFQDKEYYIAFMPALNLTSHSKLKKTAIHQLDSAVHLFFDHWTKKGKLTDKLTKLGWEREKTTKQLKPQKESINIPYSLLDKDYKKQSLKVPAVC